MAFNNSINSNQTGIQTLSSTGSWTGSTVTQNGILYGGASNAVSSLAVASTGSVLIGNTSAAPSFSATPSVTSITLGSGTALSQYVEGTWTPGIQFGGGTTGITYSLQVGTYTRIGNTVFIFGIFTVSNVGSSTGAVKITGLPYTPASGQNQYSFAINYYTGLTFAAGYTSLSATPDPTGTLIALYRAGTGVAVTALNNTTDTIAAPFQLRFMGSFQV